MRVFVYYNLHKKVWSIKDLKTNKVIAYSRYVLLENCTYKVSKKGRERVLRERKKNVHAGVVGTLVAYNNLGENLNRALDVIRVGTQVTYNPYKYETFVSRFSEKPVFNSDTVMMCANGMPAVYGT